MESNAWSLKYKYSDVVTFKFKFNDESEEQLLKGVVAIIDKRQ